MSESPKLPNPPDGEPAAQAKQRRPAPASVTPAAGSENDQIEPAIETAAEAGKPEPPVDLLH